MYCIHLPVACCITSGADEPARLFGRPFAIRGYVTEPCEVLENAIR